MNHLPIGVMAKVYLHGFAALYGIFTIGSLAIFLLTCIFLEEPLKLQIMWISLVTFLVLCVVGILLRLIKSDIFTVTEEIHLTITTEGSKIPNGEIVREVTELGKPKHTPRIERGKE